VAIVTNARCIGIAGRVAIDTDLGAMGAFQRERRTVVIKGRRLPYRIGMAAGTVVIQLVGHVVGINSRIVIRLMATIALFDCAFKCRRMALVAAHLHVRAGQGIGGRAVIKTARLPACDIVTGRAGDVEIAQYVVGIGLFIIYFFVASIALFGRTFKSGRMALAATCVNMSAGKCIAGDVVIESCRAPSCHGMAY